MKSVKIHLRKWHRRVGITIAIFLLNLSITGIILNHYEVLSLHKKMITSSWLLDWYDIKYPDNIRCLNLSKSRFCIVDNDIYHVTEEIEITTLIREQGDLINIYSSPSEIIVVTNNSLVIFDVEFALIDSISIVEETSSYITASSYQSSYQHNQLFLETENQLLVVDLDLLDIQEITVKDRTSVLFTKANLYHLENEQLKISIGKAYRQKQISQLKFIQDLHSGQLFFSTGKFLTDLVAILTIFLVISSLITWQRRKAKTI